MAKKQTDIHKFVNVFCLSIDKLLEAWNTASDNNYDTVHPEEFGCKANYLAIKSGLTSLDGKLPYNSKNWWFNSTPKGAKEKYPEVPKELQQWKKKAMALGSDIKLFTIPFETNITKENIEKFVRLADEIFDTQKYSPYAAIPYHDQQITIKGRTLNDLALELGLIDNDWYLAYKCDLERFLDFKREDLINIQTPNLKLYKELGINVNCYKLPFVADSLFESIFGGGRIDTDRLNDLVESAKKLTKKKDSKGIPINPRSQEKFRREADIVLVLRDNHNIKIAELASSLKVSKATISRSKVWQQHRAKYQSGQLSGSKVTRDSI